MLKPFSVQKDFIITECVNQKTHVQMTGSNYSSKYSVFLKLNLQNFPILNIRKMGPDIILQFSYKLGWSVIIARVKFIG